MTDPGSGDRDDAGDDEPSTPDREDRARVDDGQSDRSGTDKDRSPGDERPTTKNDRRTTEDDRPSAGADDPTPPRGEGDRRTESAAGDGGDEEVGYVEWLRTTDEPSIVVLRDVVSSVATVVVVGLLLFAISGLWPPLVAVESGSMEPHMHRGDLVFVMEQDRLPPGQAVGGTGVVTYQAARQVDRENPDRGGYRSFGNYGNVIVYERNGRASSPVIHRAHLYVGEGERWVERANPEYLEADSCEAVAACPAPYDGFVTKGDANANYDQAGGTAPRISGVVREEWVRGRAKARIPLLGHVRLLFGTLGTGTLPGGPAPGATASAAPAGAAGGASGASASANPAAASGPAGAGAGGLLPPATRLLAVVGVVGAVAVGTRR
jgi:signal peptidase